VSFGEPLWLVAALVVAVAALLFWRRADRRRRADLTRFASLHLLPDLTAEVSPRRRATKRGLVLAAVALCGAALADPRWGFRWEETRRRGIDVLIALDVSRSMLAQDVAPSRLARAKLAIVDLVDKLGGDRVGLIAFAGSAFLQCPLTLDHGAFLDALQALEPGVVEAPGSDLASALRTAQQALATEQRNVKLLVLFSDGEDLGGGAVAQAKRAVEDGIHVYTVGVGSPAGELIPLAKEGGGTEFLKGPDGQFVKSRLDADTLRGVAEATGGFYEPLGQRGEGVDEVWERALAPLPKEDLASRMRRVPIARFQWPLAAALLLIALEPWLRERRGAGRAAVLALLTFALVAPRTAHAASAAEAERLYEAGRYDEALAAYRAGEYGDASAAFARALRSAEPRIQEQSFYNLGNAQFRAGQQTREADPQQTVAAWQQALDAYDAALEIDPEDEDARFNREFVQRELERLQQEQQQQDDEKKQDEQEKDEEKDEQQKDQEQGEDGQSGEDGAPEDRPQEPSPPEPRDGDQEQKQEPQQSGGEQEQEPGDEPGDGQPQPRDDAAPQGEERAGAPPPRPGQMSPADAKALLDSLQDGEETMPALQAQQAPARALDPERDW
jgi:Ca-activated chloride channel family protein